MDDGGCLVVSGVLGRLSELAPHKSKGSLVSVTGGSLLTVGGEGLLSIGRPLHGSIARQDKIARLPVITSGKVSSSERIVTCYSNKADSGIPPFKSTCNSFGVVRGKMVVVFSHQSRFNRNSGGFTRTETILYALLFTLGGGLAVARLCYSSRGVIVEMGSCLGKGSGGLSGGDSLPFIRRYVGVEGLVFTGENCGGRLLGGTI